MKKRYIIYEENDKLKKGVLDENLYKKYKSNPNIKNLQEYDSELLMERTYAIKVGSISGKQTLLD